MLSLESLTTPRPLIWTVQRRIAPETFFSLEHHIFHEYLKLRGRDRSGKAPAFTIDDASQIAAILTQGVAKARTRTKKEARLRRQWARCVKDVRQQRKLKPTHSVYAHNGALWDCIQRVTAWLGSRDYKPKPRWMFVRVPQGKQPPTFPVGTNPGPPNMEEVLERRRELAGYVTVGALVAGAWVVPKLVRLFIKK